MTRRLLVTLTRTGEEPVRGWVQDEVGERVAFSGLLELIALLEAQAVSTAGPAPG